MKNIFYGLHTRGSAGKLVLACCAALAIAPVASGAEKGKGPHGAIAYERVSANFGYAVNGRTARDAKMEALKQCGKPACEVVSNFRNGCGAVAKGSKQFKAATGAVRQEAESKALRLCGAGCEIVVWACTP